MVSEADKALKVGVGEHPATKLIDCQITKMPFPMMPREEYTPRQEFLDYVKER